MKFAYPAILLLLLPSLMPAAPAPLPRVNRHPEPGGWSGTVGGLRVRLVAPQTHYRVNEAVRLTLEIQNVTTSAIAVEEPELDRYVTKPGRQSGWAITCEPVGDRPAQWAKRGMMQELAKRDSTLSLLRPGRTLQIEIRIENGFRELRKRRELEKGERRVEELHFADAEEPGVYELRATFAPDREARKIASERDWPGQGLTTPPVRIELRK